MKKTSSRSIKVILSGHVVRPETADMRPFWQGFIDLQKGLAGCDKVDVISCHSWNPGTQDFVKHVYSPLNHTCEPQPPFFGLLFDSRIPWDFFELDLDRENSTWKNVNVQSVFGNLTSRSKAIAMAEFNDTCSDDDVVLVTRWDLGQTGGSEVNRLVFDPSLPQKYLYLAYYSEVDEGYADMWLWGPPNIVFRLSQLANCALDCLSGRNDYLKQFTVSGWPNSVMPSTRQRMKNLYLFSVLKNCSIRFTEYFATGTSNSLLYRALRWISRYVLFFIDVYPSTAENSMITGKSEKRIFPNFQALNVHAILKYFLIKEGLREDVRFLSSTDFTKLTASGGLINFGRYILILNVTDIKTYKEADVRLDLIAQRYRASLLLVQYNDFVIDQINIIDELPPLRDQKGFRLKEFLEQNFGILSNQAVFSIPFEKIDILKPDLATLNALVKFVSWEGKKMVYLEQLQGGRASTLFPELFEHTFVKEFNLNYFVSSFDYFYARSSLEFDERKLHQYFASFKIKFFSYAPKEPVFLAKGSHNGS